jgi:uncharacterized repeat protein (TIGR01451 family)
MKTQLALVAAWLVLAAGCAASDADLVGAACDPSAAAPCGTSGTLVCDGARGRCVLATDADGGATGGGTGTGGGTSTGGGTATGGGSSTGGGAPAGGGTGDGGMVDPPASLLYTPTLLTCSRSQVCTGPAPTHTGGAPSAYSLVPSLPTGFALNPTTGVVSGTSSVLVPKTAFTVTGANSAGSTTAQVQLEVIDAAPGTITYASTSLTCTKGSPCSLAAPTVTGGTVLAFAVAPVLPAGLTIDPVSGAVTGTPVQIAATASYTITGTNTGGSATTTLEVTVNDAPPTALTYAPNAIVCTRGTPCTLAAPTHGGGVVVAYAIAPALPAGLSLDPTTGVVGGTATGLAPAATYTVTATNSGGSATATVTVTVNDVRPSALTYAPNAKVCVKGQPCSFAAPTATGGPITSVTIAPMLPAGLALNASTGAIGGTPSVVAAMSSYTVTAANSGGSTTTTVTLTVNDVPPSTLVYSPSTVVCTKGQACSIMGPTNTGGALVGCTVAPALPSGLVLNVATCGVAGTPTVLATAGSYVVTGTNTGGSNTGSFSLTVNDAAPTGLAYAAPLTCTRGQPCALAAPTNGGGVATGYSVSPALPTGLTLNALTGAFSGTPTAVTAAATYTVTATNTGGSTSTSLVITVNDTQPNAPTYSPSSLTCTRGTACGLGAPDVHGVTVTSFAVAPPLPSGLALNPVTGAISGTPTGLSPTATYTVTASNSGGMSTTSVPITVNEVAPSALTYASTTLTCTKGSPCGLAAPSSSGGAVVSYAVAPALPSGLTLDPDTGAISGTPTAIVAATSYTVTATNSGGSTSAALTIDVRDVPPTSLVYAQALLCTRGEACSLPGPTNGGGVVISYAISPALPAGLTFATGTGAIAGTPSVAIASTSFTVTATNSGGSTTTTVTVTVNDVAPASISYSPSTLVCTKGASCVFNAPSVTGGAVTSWSISPALPTGLSLNATGAIVGTPTVLASLNSYTVTGTNSGGSATASIFLTVNDVAPNSLTYATNPASYVKGTAISPNLPSNAGGAVTGYSVSPALPAGLSLDAVTGVISGTPAVVSAAATYTVTATNTGGSTTATLNLTVNDQPPTALVYAPNTLTCTRTQACSLAGPSNSGGVVVSYAISPTLPAGLTFSAATGAIVGTPTLVAAATSFTVTGTNSGGSATTTITVTVNDLAPSGLAYLDNPAVYTRGTAISNNTPSNTGGVVVSYAINPALPTGLAFSSATGIISGTPTVISAASTYTVTATNTGGSTTASLVITVNDSPPTGLTYSTPAPVYVKDTAIAPNTPSSSGGAVISYSVNPALPTGLTLSTTDGIITGTPTVVTASAPYVVTATNTGGSTTVSLTITVNDVAPSGLSYAVASATYTRGVAITPNAPTNSGGAIISYAISPPLPAGLTLSPSSGVISGTPTATLPMSAFTVTATNSGGSTTAGLTITVNEPAPEGLAYAVNPATYVKGTAITANTITSSGGAVASYGITPALPLGLAFSVVNGTISGTPTVVAPMASYTVTATNSGGSATVELVLTVNDVPPTTITYAPSSAVCVLSTPCTLGPPSVAGGAIVSYAVSPALPPGLTLAPATGVISGSASALQAAATYTVTGTNSGGSANTTVTLSVVNAPVPASLAVTFELAGTPGTPALAVTINSTPMSSVTGTTTLALNVGDAVKLELATGSFIAWRGACNTTAPVCQFTLAGNQAVTAVFGPPNYAFVTSVSRTGDLGGPGGGDTLCAACATDAGLPGQYKAWLATSTESAYQRLNLSAASGWVRPDGRVFIADTGAFASSQAARVAYPPRLDEHGLDVGVAAVMTGAGDNGLAQNACADWSTDLGLAVYGQARFGIGWSGAAQSGCGAPRRLYCMRTDIAGTLSLPARTGRLAFVSPRVTPNAGVAQLDLVCATSAADTGATGSFLAFVPTATSSAVGRFNLAPGSQRWQRADGVYLTETVNDLATGNLLAPLQTMADAGETGDPAFTGFSVPSQSGNASTSCSFWTEPTQTAVAGLANSSGDDAFDATTFTCGSAGVRAYCLQE